MQLLRDDHGERWSRGELGSELNIGAGELAAAIEHLEDEGVVVIPDEAAVIASPCARHLDALGLIGI
ncbi:MAG: hypothetical protein ACYDC2_09805 [Solirubrobacteraceae bacterium]